MAQVEAVFANQQARLSSLLRLVLQRTGIDFAGYRLSTVQRRILNRMATVRIDTLDTYVALVESSPAETAELLEHMTIKVSRFYRNACTFDALKDEVIPGLVLTAGDRPVSVWSAGCGRGEEAYTLAMILEHLDAPGVVTGTDIDAAALRFAAEATYPAASIGELPPDFASRYLERTATGRGDAFRVCRAIRDRVTFRTHDVTCPDAAPPGARFDLVSCRNVLIYLEGHTQETALRTLRSALSPHGVLCLGEAEWPSAGVAGSLRPLGPRTRVFAAAPAVSHGATA